MAFWRAGDEAVRDDDTWILEHRIGLWIFNCCRYSGVANGSLRAGLDVEPSTPKSDQRLRRAACF